MGRRVVVGIFGHGSSIKGSFKGSRGGGRGGLCRWAAGQGRSARGSAFWWEQAAGGRLSRINRDREGRKTDLSGRRRSRMASHGTAPATVRASGRAVPGDAILLVVIDPRLDPGSIGSLVPPPGLRRRGSCPASVTRDLALYRRGPGRVRGPSGERPRSPDKRRPRQPRARRRAHRDHHHCAPFTRHPAASFPPICSRAPAPSRTLPPTPAFAARASTPTPARAISKNSL